MTFDKIDTYLAAGRYAVTYAGGVMTALGLSSTVDPQTLQDGFNHVFNGIKEVAVGFGILAPVAATTWGIFEQTIGRLVAKVHAASPADLMRAVVDQTPGTLAKATATIPGVQVTVSAAAPQSLRVLAADDMQPDIVKSSLTAPAVSPPTARVQK